MVVGTAALLGDFYFLAFPCVFSAVDYAHRQASPCKGELILRRIIRGLAVYVRQYTVLYGYCGSAGHAQGSRCTQEVEQTNLRASASERADHAWSSSKSEGYTFCHGQ